MPVNVELGKSNEVLSPHVREWQTSLAEAQQLPIPARSTYRFAMQYPKDVTPDDVFAAFDRGIPEFIQFGYEHNTPAYRSYESERDREQFLRFLGCPLESDKTPWEAVRVGDAEYRVKKFSKDNMYLVRHLDDKGFFPELIEEIYTIPEGQDFTAVAGRAFRQKEGGRNIALVARLEEKIRREGPIPFSKLFSAWATGIHDAAEGPIPGYYTSGTAVIGNGDGIIPKEWHDFTTTPEATPLFGYLMAQQILEMYRAMGSPKDFEIVEMGAGNGALAHDIIHGLRYFDPENAEKIKYTLVEYSDALIAKQKKRLEGLEAQFIQSSAEEFPKKDIVGVVLSNELPDAMPVEIVTQQGGQLRQLHIGLGNDEKFEPVWKPVSSDVSTFVAVHGAVIEEGNLYPVNQHAAAWMVRVANALRAGYVITVDYPLIKQKEPIRLYASDIRELDKDGLEGMLTKSHVGISDVTSDVDFQMLADVGENHGLKPIGFVTQGGFAQGLGFHALRGKFASSLKIGNRRHFFERDDVILKEFGVLVQGKNVPESLLSGLKHTFHDQETDKNMREFTPLRGKQNEIAA